MIDLRQAWPEDRSVAGDRRFARMNLDVRLGATHPEPPTGGDGMDRAVHRVPVIGENGASGMDHRRDTSRPNHCIKPIEARNEFGETQARGPLRELCRAVFGRLIGQVTRRILVLETRSQIVKYGSTEAMHPLITDGDTAIDMPEVAIDRRIARLEVLDLRVDVDVTLLLRETRAHAVEDTTRQWPCETNSLLERTPAEGHSVVPHCFLRRRFELSDEPQVVRIVRVE